jgi:hypothetical protein
MVKKHAQLPVLMILLAALSATGQAQDLNTVINNVYKATGSQDLKSLRYSGSGSSYMSGKNIAFVKSYTRDLDLNAPVSRTQIVREQGSPPTEAKESQNLTSDAPWSKQFELWTNPWVFLKAAAANKAIVSTQTVFAEKYTVLTFNVQNKYKVSGFVNAQNMIEKIQAWIDPNETLVETTYREYQDFEGLKFPTMIVEKQADELALILIVTDVKPNAALN